MVDVKDIYFLDAPSDVFDLEGKRVEIQQDSSLGIRFRLSLDGEPDEVAAYVRLLCEKPVRVVKTMAGEDFVDFVLVIPKTGQLISLVNG